MSLFLVASGLMLFLFNGFAIFPQPAVAGLAAGLCLSGAILAFAGYGRKD